MLEITSSIIISGTAAMGGSSSSTDGQNLEAAKRSSDVEPELSSIATFIPDHDSDLPLNEDDEMDIFLNLEGDNDPQQSSGSLKKHRLEEGEEFSSSYTYL